MSSRMCRGNKISLTLFGASSPDYHPCSKAIFLWWFLLFYVLLFKIFVLLAPYVCYHILVKFR